MKPHEGEIEVSLPVTLDANFAFWIDKAEWDGMSDEAKLDLVIEKVNHLAHILSDDVLSFDPGNLSVLITGPEDGTSLADLSFYDPEAEG